MGAGNFQRAPGTPVGVQPNELFLNDGTGHTFLDVSSATGAADTGDTKGVAFADYDMDGDIDMFVIDQGGTTHLFQNNTPRGTNHWLEVRAAGTSSDRDGCGATVEVAGLGPEMQRTISCGSGTTGSETSRLPISGSVRPLARSRFQCAGRPVAPGRSTTLQSISYSQSRNPRNEHRQHPTNESAGPRTVAGFDRLVRAGSVEALRTGEGQRQHQHRLLAPVRSTPCWARTAPGSPRCWASPVAWFNPTRVKW